MKRFVVPLACLLWALAPAPGSAIEWPNHPVRVVVPYSAGGQSDVVGRVLAQALSNALGQPFYIENQTGAGGAIAAKSVARAEPDGYTLMITGLGTHVLAPAINKTIGFDPLNDFTHVAYIGGSPNVFVLHPSVGVRSFPEFIRWAKGTSGGIEYVSPGVGSAGHSVAAYFAAKAGLNLVHVPHRGGGNAIADLIAGHVKMGSVTWATAREHVGSGTLVPIVVSSMNRLREVPELPTLNELGYPDIVSSTWLSISGPAGLPRQVVLTLNREVNRALQQPHVREVLERDAFEITPMTPDEVTDLMRREVDRWVPALREALKMK